MTCPGVANKSHLSLRVDKTPWHLRISVRGKNHLAAQNLRPVPFPVVLVRRAVRVERIPAPKGTVLHGRTKRIASQKGNGRRSRFVWGTTLSSAHGLPRVHRLTCSPLGSQNFGQTRPVLFRQKLFMARRSQDYHDHAIDCNMLLNLLCSADVLQEPSPRQPPSKPPHLTCFT